MWREILDNLQKYSSAVLNGLDDEGYPYSVRCYPQPDENGQTLRLELAHGLSIQPGPASLLCHKHNERLWDLQSFAVRGLLEQSNGEWIFRPKQFIPGAGGGMFDLVRTVFGCRKSARQYLERRGLQRPIVAWDEVHECQREAAARRGS